MSQSAAHTATAPVQISPLPQLVPSATAENALVDAPGLQTSQAPLPDDAPSCPEVYSVPPMSQSAAQAPTAPVQISPLPQLVPTGSGWNALVEALGVQTSHAPLP